MKKYLVTFKSVDYFVYEVEAENEEEASQLTQESVACGVIIHVDHWCDSYEEVSIEVKGEE